MTLRQIVDEMREAVKLSQNSGGDVSATYIGVWANRLETAIAQEDEADLAYWRDVAAKREQRICELLQAQLDLARPAAPVAGEWLPIETAPKDGTRVLLCDNAREATWIGYYKPVYGSGYRPSNPWSSLMLNHEYQARPSWTPTHWMHLFAAPTPDGGTK